jgi:hypothetical protein
VSVVLVGFGLNLTHASTRKATNSYAYNGVDLGKSQGKW